MLKKILQHRLFKNTSALLIMQLFTYVAPFVVLPYLSRVLGADGFGLMVAALSLTIIANVCTDFGFNLSATYVISRKQGQIHYISKIITAIYSLKLALLIIVFVGIAIYLVLVTSYTPIAIGAIYLTVFFQTFLSPWLFQGIEKMKLITYSTIASRLFYIATILALVKNRDEYDIALMCHAMATALACLLANSLIFREGFSFTKPSRRLVKLMFTHSSQFFLSRVTLQASSSLSVLALNSYVGVVQVGLFGASQKLFGAITGLIQPFSQALYPYMAKTGNYRLLIRVVALVSSFMIIPAAIGSIYAEQILVIIFGSEFAGAKNIFRIFVFTGYMAFFTVNFGYPAFAAMRRVDLANKSVIISGGIQIGFLVLLVITDNITAFNVALSILITESITLSLRLCFLAYLRSNTQV